MIGDIKINDEIFDSYILDKKIHIKCNDYRKMQCLNNKWCLFYNHFYSGLSNVYMIFLENGNCEYNDLFEFDIVYLYSYKNEKIESISFRSFAITNFFNERFKFKDEESRKQYIDHIYQIMEKKEEINIKLNFGNYFFEFQNSFIISDCDSSINNIIPFLPQTVLTIKKESGIIDSNDILKLIKYVFEFNRFITINNYTKIDECMLNYKNCNVIVNIYKDYEKINKYAKCFHMTDFGDSLAQLLIHNGEFLNHSNNMYTFDDNKVYDFDIVRVSGAFEKIFNKYIAKNKEYENYLNKIKNEIHYNEFQNLICIFKKKYKLNNNEIFESMYMNFKRFGTLKQKLDFIIIKFCECMEFQYGNIKKKTYLYTPGELSSRFKNARNDISHGLENKNTKWYGASRDLFFVQQLIYFIILKYVINLPDKKIKTALNRIYYPWNLALK